MLGSKGVKLGEFRRVNSGISNVKCYFFLACGGLSLSPAAGFRWGGLRPPHLPGSVCKKKKKMSEKVGFRNFQKEKFFFSCINNFLSKGWCWFWFEKSKSWWSSVISSESDLKIQFNWSGIWPKNQGGVPPPVRASGSAQHTFTQARPQLFTVKVVMLQPSQVRGANNACKMQKSNSLWNPKIFMLQNLA